MEAAETPNHLAMVAPYWSTEVDHGAARAGVVRAAGTFVPNWFDRAPDGALSHSQEGEADSAPGSANTVFVDFKTSGLTY
jgi:hypothetical protein